MKFNTALLHAGVLRNERFGATLSPVYQNTAFDYSSAEELANVFSHKAPGYNYTRTGNPTVSNFENRITMLENGIASVAFSSGMAAITNTLLNILKSGDEVVASASLYGGVYYFFEHVKNLGITTKFVENNDLESFAKAITPSTRAIYAETIGNPRLDVTDIKALAEFAHERKLPLIIDNTVSTPYLIRPLDHGADIVINSSSKYINGSSNSISGVLTINGKFDWNSELFPEFQEYVKKFGPLAFVAKLRDGLFRDLGACLAPQNAYLNMIGMETLGLRMERQSFNAKALSEWFEKNYPCIEVNYPGLVSSKWHNIAVSQFENGFGAIVTIRVGTKKIAFDLIRELKFAYRVSNIGDVRTLVVHPASTIAVHSTEEQRKSAGVYDDLIRISVGIEDIEDLIEDFDSALKKVLKEN
ncbi:MAG: O-acetylhomoserine aminocarboxypropyltransferase/cysteine synthase family protein [Succinivibrionaceae bacterium]